MQLIKLVVAAVAAKSAVLAPASAVAARGRSGAVVARVGGARAGRFQCPVSRFPAGDVDWAATGGLVDAPVLLAERLR